MPATWAAGQRFMAVAPSGALFCATQHQVLQYANNVWTNPLQGAPFTIGNINSMATDAAGNLVLCTADSLFVQNGNTWTTFDQYNSANLPGTGAFACLANTPTGDVFVARGHQLLKYSQGVWTIAGASNPAFANMGKINFLKVVSTTQFWIGSGDHLYFVDGDLAYRTFTLSNSTLGDNQVLNVATGPNNYIWTMDKANTLARFNTQWGLLSLPTLGNTIRDIAAGPNGTVYVALQNKGVYQYKNYQWTLLDSVTAGFLTHQINAIAVSPLGELWMATADKGLMRFANNTCMAYNSSNSTITSDYIDHVMLAPNGAVWCNTAAGELICMQNGTLTNDPLPYLGGAPAHISDLQVSPDGYVFFTDPQQGLFVRDGGQWWAINMSGFTTVGLSSIIPLGNGNVWAGTLGKGLGYFNGQSQTWTQLHVCQ